MSLITKLSVLHTSKFPNQVLKTFTTTHKNQSPQISRVGCKKSQNRSRSLPCRPVNSFGLIHLLQRSVSPNPNLIRRAEISYISSKINLLKEWQKRLSKGSNTSLGDREVSKKSSLTSVVNPKLNKLKDTIKNILFRKKSETAELPVDEFENTIPNTKMKIFSCGPGGSNTRVEITHVDLEEQGRLTPKIPYRDSSKQAQIDDVNLRPILYCKDVEDRSSKRAKASTKKKFKDAVEKSKCSLVEVICVDVDNDVKKEPTKKAKYVPFQNMNETITEPKVSPRSPSAIVSVADICKEIDKNCRTRISRAEGRHVVSYPVKKKISYRSGSRSKPKPVMNGKAKSLDEPEPKVKKSNYWAKPKSRGQAGLSNKPAKVEPCDPYKDSKRKLSHVSCNEANNLTKLSYENYVIPCEAEANLAAENDIFSWYESSENVGMKNLSELRKNQSNLKVTKPKAILSQKKALATSHVDILNTQLLCSNLFCSSSTKQFSENLQPFQVKSYLTQPNYDLSDLGVLNLVVAHDKEIRKVEWEKHKSDIFDLKPKEKICKPKPKLAEDKENEVGEHESKILTKAEDEKFEEQEEEPKAKATAKTSDGKNSPIKPITFIKKDFHTLSSFESFASRKLEAEDALLAYSTKAKKGGCRRRVVYISDKEVDKSDPCHLDDILKRAKMKQGKSLMKHTEWKAVPIRGMRNAVQERKRIRDEREKYKELIRIRSNSRERPTKERCILHTPFDKVDEPKQEPKRSSDSLPGSPCDSRKRDKVFAILSSNNIDDCGCVATNTRKPPAWSNEIMDPRKKLECIKKKIKCVQTHECQDKLRIILRDMKESAEKLRKLEKLMRKNRNYNSNCDSVKSRNLRKKV